MTKKKETEMKNLLKKKVSELTPEERKALEKPLGTARRPFPMFGTMAVEYDGRRELQQFLTMVASDSKPMKIFSERSYEEVVGMAYRDMPVPSMLPMFFDGLERRKLDNKNRIQFTKGDPGAGKSFMSALMGRMRSTEAPEVLDCGGKNMRELLFEMVLDFGAGDPLPQAIDKRIQAGALSDVSVNLLKQLPGVDEDKKGRLVIDWADVSKGDEKKVSKVYDVLKQVSHIEGLDNQGGNALGMNSQYGPAITSFIEGRELTLDEYNKSKEGTDDNLQTFLQFANGEIDTCTVENPLKNKDASSGPSEFTFRREDVKAGWFLNLTGNAKEDGMTTRQLNKSVYSRLSPQTIPEPTEMDWQHRICQIMTGLPVSTLYNVFKEQADANPDQFTETLKYWRTAGLSQDEIDNIPEIQMTFIDNWKSVVEATEKLAKFYNTWQIMVNEDKGPAIFGSELYEEIDQAFEHEVSIDFRKVIQHMDEAMPVKAKMEQITKGAEFEMGAWGGDAPEIHEEEAEETALNFGTRLTDLLVRHVYETSGAIGKPNLYKLLVQQMEQIGLKDMDFQEAARSSERSVEDLLNISVFNDTNPSNQAKLVQQVLCDFLRENAPELKAEDEEIVTQPMLEKILGEYRDQTAEDAANDVIIPTSDLEAVSEGNVFDKFELVDTSMMSDDEVEQDLYVDDVVDHDRFMASLIMPVVGDKNLEAVQDQNLIENIRRENENTADKGDASNDFNSNAVNDNGSANDNNDNSIDPDDLLSTVRIDEPLKIAQNVSDTGMSATTVIVARVTDETEEYIPVHIIRNKNRGKTMVVADEVSPRMEAMFKQAGMIYVDRNAAGAEAKIENGLSEVFRGVSSSVRSSVKAAVMLRYSYSDDDKSLAQVMAQKSVPGVSASEEDAASHEDDYVPPQKFVMMRPGK